MTNKKTPTPVTPSGEASMTFEAVLICDQVRREDNAKLLFIGVYTDIVNVSRLPFPINLTLVAQVRVMEAGSFRFNVNVTDPLGNNVVEGLAGEGRYEGEEGRTAWFPIALPPFVMSAEGEYVARIDFDGGLGRSERFVVRKLIPPVQPITSAPN